MDFMANSRKMVPPDAIRCPRTSCCRQATASNKRCPQGTIRRCATGIPHEQDTLERPLFESARRQFYKRANHNFLPFGSAQTVKIPIATLPAHRILPRFQSWHFSLTEILHDSNRGASGSQNSSTILIVALSAHKIPPRFQSGRFRLTKFLHDSNRRPSR